VGRSSGADLFSLAEDVDLWRLRRDSAQRPREGTFWQIGRTIMDFRLTEEQRLLKDTLNQLITKLYPFDRRKLYQFVKRRVEPRDMGTPG